MVALLARLLTIWGPKCQAPAVLSPVFQAFQSQSSVGWIPLIFGFPVEQGRVLQQRHHTSINSTRSCKRWATEIMKKLLAISWDMWRHRNGVLHDPDSTANRKLTSELDESILYQFELGAVGLLVSTYFFPKKVIP